MATTKPPRLRAPLATVTRSAATRVPITPTRPRARAPAKRAADLVSTVETLRHDIDARFYELGLALRELQRPEMYRALGFTSFEALLAGRELMSRPTAFKFINVVESFPKPVATKLGIEKAYGVIRYTKLAHASRTPVEVLALDPVIRHDQKTAPLSRISARALNAAVSARELAKNQPAPAPAARLSKASRSLSQLLRHAGIAPERVQTKPRRGKPPIIRIELTVEEAEDLIALVKARK